MLKIVERCIVKESFLVKTCVKFQFVNYHVGPENEEI